MQRILIWVFVLTIWHASPSYGESALGGRLASLLPKNARWAVSVVDMESGKEIMDIKYLSSFDKLRTNGLEEALVPGSLMKLFTTGAV